MRYFELGVSIRAPNLPPRLVLNNLCCAVRRQRCLLFRAYRSTDAATSGVDTYIKKQTMTFQKKRKKGKILLCVCAPRRFHRALTLRQGRRWACGFALGL